MEIQDKYNKVKSQVKEIAGNSTYNKNIVLATAAIIVLLIYGGTIAFVTDAFTSPMWWVNVIVECIAMCMLFLSLVNIFNEKQRQLPAFRATVKLFADKVYCCNDNQDKRTYEGMMNEVNEFNKKQCEKVWRKKLRKAVGSLLGTELSKLNNDFSEFEKMDDNWWFCFFEKESISEKHQKRIMKTVMRIRSNDYKVPKLITVDAVLYDTFNDDDTVSPVYNERKDIMRGVLYRMVSLVSITILFAMVFFDQSPDVKGWVWAIIVRFFMVASTIYMANSLAQIMSVKRRNSLLKRINILESAFNFCGLSKEIRAKYYSVVGVSTEER